MGRLSRPPPDASQDAGFPGYVGSQFRQSSACQFFGNFSLSGKFVYMSDIEVQDCHSYFVGEHGILGSVAGAERTESGQ